MLETGRIQEWDVIRSINPQTSELDCVGVALGTARSNGVVRCILGLVEYRKVDRDGAPCVEAHFVKHGEIASREVARATMLDALASYAVNVVSPQNPSGNLGVVCTFKTRNPWLKNMLIEDEEVVALAAEKKEQKA